MIDWAAWAEVVQLLRAAARVEVMPRFRKLQPGMVRTKSSPTDLVTEADEAAEVMITRGLERLFPGCLVIGEEACAADPTLLGRMAGAELAFVVDPIDGTSNYCAGLPLFGVMAAAVVRGEVVAGAIHDPVCDDVAVALRGEGAWQEAPTGERTRLAVSHQHPPGGDDGVRVLAVHARAAAQYGGAQHACAGRRVRLPLRRARVPGFVGWAPRLPGVQSVDAVGPLAGLAVASGGWRLLGAF